MTRQSLVSPKSVPPACLPLRALLQPLGINFHNDRTTREGYARPWQKKIQDNWGTFERKALFVACSEALLRLRCQVLKCPCHSKWQNSGHLTFLPTPLAGAWCFLMTLSASCQVSQGEIWRGGKVTCRRMLGKGGKMQWRAVKGARLRICLFMSVPPLCGWIIAEVLCIVHR